LSEDARGEWGDEHPSMDDAWDTAEFALAADRLDTPDVIAAADPGDMLRQVASSAAQVRTALRSVAETDLSGFTADARPRAVVVAGMGTSGIAGELLSAVAGSSCPVQVDTVHTDRLPGWIGAADVVLAVSKSGTTAETLAVTTEAARRGCRLVCVGAEGSPLHRIAEQARAPFIQVAATGPVGSVLGRQSPWALGIPVLVVAERLGVVRIGADVYEETARRLEEVSHQCRPASESFVNPGKSLALDLVGALPVIWATSPLTGVAARRFAYQLHENAKYPAIAGVLPDVMHNQAGILDGPFAPGPASLETAGFTPVRVVLISDPPTEGSGPDGGATISDLAAQRGVSVSELAADGEHPLVRLGAIIQLADYASVYLAIASGIDPGQEDTIRDISAQLE
jgi:glucose/mannose-6-phosphate isomerase